MIERKTSFGDHTQGLVPTSSQPEPALEVNRDAEGLQVDPNGAYPGPMMRTEKSAPGYNEAGYVPSEQSTPKDQKEGICGLRKRTFFIILAVVIVVVCAAVGGGVGGYYGTKKSSSPTPTSESKPTSIQRCVSIPLLLASNS